MPAFYHRRGSLDAMRWLCCALLALAACGKDDGLPPLSDGLVRVTAASPLAGCSTQGQTGTNFPGAEVEPFVAVDPTNAKHLIGVWQQDRWSNGGANALFTGVSFDGGATWAKSALPYTHCTGGAFQRASDPWVTFAPDGTAHQIGFGFDNADARAAMLASRSTDGGRSWSAPLSLFEDNDPDFAIDKESITADPAVARNVYAVWDRLTGETTPGAATNTGPAWFTRTTDGGHTWENARVIYDPGANAQTISNQIAVLPGGALVDLLVIIHQINQQDSPMEVAVLRSTDKGTTWSQPIVIAQMQTVGVYDPKQRSVAIRSGDVVPDVAVDRADGALYVAWEDARFGGGVADGIVLSKSADGGMTWSLPVRVNGVPTTQAFTPAVEAEGGKVGVTYYDLRDDDPADPAHVLAAAWLAISGDGGATFQDTRISAAFDVRTAPKTGEGYFLGDYQGLVATGGSFLPFFVIANTGSVANRTDVAARPIAGTAASAAVASIGFAAPRRTRIGRRRAF